MDDTREDANFNLTPALCLHLLRINPCHTTLIDLQGTHARGDTMCRQNNDETRCRLVMAHNIAQGDIGL